MFMAKYFLHENGDPAPAKHPAALVLTGGYWSSSSVADKAQNVNGLKIYGSYMTGLGVIGWQGPAFEKGMDEAFSTLSKPGAHKHHVPTMEAFFDIDRFLAKYFLTGLKGKPDATKTKSPIKVLWGDTNPLNGVLSGPKEQKMAWVLCNAVKSIPKLSFARANDNRNTCFIGWNLEKVNACAREVEVAEREKERKEKEAEGAEKRAREERAKQRVFGKHWVFSKTYRAPGGPLKLQHITGSYVVKCDLNEKHYYGEDTYGNEISMGLRIQAPKNDVGTTASFELCIVEGVMLMALSDDALAQFQRDIDKVFEYGSEGYGDESEEYGGESTSNKRKAAGKPDNQPLAIRRRLGEAPRPNRVYLRWRGWDAGSGKPQIACGDEAIEHADYLDFSEDRLTGVGEFKYPEFFGEERKIEIKVYRESSTVDATKDFLRESWCDMDERRPGRYW